MKKKWTPHVITVGALAVFVVLGLACGSSEPAVRTAKDYNSFPNSHDINFVGEWRFTNNNGESRYRIFNNDGTGTYGGIYADGARDESRFQWRNDAGWILLIYENDNSQVSYPYTFSNNYQRVTFEDTRQKNGYLYQGFSMSKIQ
jgi:hypothetical protein